MFKNLTETQKQYFYVAGIAFTLAVVAVIFHQNAFLAWFAWSASLFATASLITVISLLGVGTLKTVKNSQK